MGTIKQLHDRVSAVDLRSETREIIRNTSGIIAELNRQQLYSGFDVDGKKLERYSSVRYAIDKQRMNSLPGFMVMDLKLTGSFYDSFFVTVGNDTFTTDSSDRKTDRLIGLQPGHQLFGISKPNVSRYAFGPFFDGLKKYLEQTTGLEMK